jgi:hypothetical protein
MSRVSRSIVVLTIALAAGCAARGPAPRPPAPSAGSATRAAVNDSTHGRFINVTSWSLRVWVDAKFTNGEPAPSVTLQPGETAAWTLAQGEHRIVAHARAPGSSAETAVARFDRTIALDPKRSEGWYLRFREADFR